MSRFNFIYAEEELGHRAKTVYIYLRDRSDASGVCWPGIKTIARELELSPRTVQRALGDFTIEFEPAATTLEQQNAGYVVASLGVDSGYVPYTAYSAKSSYMKGNPDVIQSFTNALQKGMDYVQTHTPEEIAEVIAPQFKENDLETITAIVRRYYEQDTWKENLIFEKESFELLQDILQSAGELEERTPYEKLVTTKYAKNAAK